MFLLKTEKDLIESFRAQDQSRIELPKLLRFPLVVRDYFAWSDSSGSRVSLVVADPGTRKPLGVIFDREKAGGPQAAICEWCHSYGSANQIGLLTLAVSSKRRVGVHLCLDLSCREKIESNLSLSPIAAQARAKAVAVQMTQFLRRLIF